MDQPAGKVAFVTGGASGIGLGLTRAFLEAGMSVAVADTRQDHLAEADAVLSATGGRFHLVELDVTDRELWPEAVDEVERKLGAVDVLCNNAGIAILGDLAGTTWDDWDWVTGVNLTGVFNGIATVLPRIRARGEGGHVLVTSSVGGLIAGTKSVIYQTCKFGVVALVECLRDDLAAEGIGVSVLCPSGVATNIHDHSSMRPTRYARTNAQAPPPGAAGEMKEVLKLGSDPVDVGRHVLAEMQRDVPYIVTDPAVRALVEARLDAILAATDLHAGD